jgi:anaerobic magnesium-protoporphyrin IX monomethyl ester cyclase
MRVAFLNPPRIERSLAGFFKIRSPVYRFNRGVDLTHTTVASPSELAGLAAFVENKGFEVELVDANALDWSYEQTCRKLREIRPDYLVVRAGYSTITEDVRFIRFGEAEGMRPILWENTLSPVYTDRLIRDYGLRRILYGEPEGGILRFLEGCGGAIGGSPVADLDSLPMPLMEKLPMHLYRRGREKWWYMFTHRGCVWGRCSFCLEYGATLRMRSVDGIQEEVEAAKSHGMDGIFFWEPELNTSWERAVEISEIMKANKLKWECWFRADYPNPDVFKKMAESGCQKMSIGVENGDQDVLDLFNKGVMVEQIRETFKLAKRCGIATQAFHIFGTPYDTVETFRKTLQLLREIKPTMNVPTPFIPWPNAPMTEVAHERGLLIRDLYEAAVGGDCLVGCVFCIPPGMKRSDYDRWLRMFYREAFESAMRFYMKRPNDWGFAARDYLSRQAFNHIR